MLPQGDHRLFEELGALVDRLRRVRSGLIVFDGFGGAGKTTLVRMLAPELGCEWIDADAFVDKNRGQYLEGIDLDGLKTVIALSLEKAAVALFAGLCAREILERIGHSPSLYVYVYELPSDGVFRDPDASDGSHLPEEFWLDRRVIEYHRQFQPYAKSDLVFIRRRTEARTWKSLGWEEE